MPEQVRRRWGRWRRAAVAIGVVAGLTGGLAAAAKCDPRFHRDRTRPPTAAEERLARNLITKVAGLRPATDASAAWAVGLTERELNAWLAVDLPRNHARLLPAGVSEPRVQLLPGRVRGAARFGSGWASAVGWAEVEVRRRDDRSLVARVAAAGLGLLPLPHGMVLGMLDRELGRGGWATERVRLDGGTVLVVYMAGTGNGGATPASPPDSFLLENGELLLSGGPRDATAPRGERR